MSCRRIALLACVAAGCADDGVIEVDLHGRATQLVSLYAATEEVEPAGAEYRWSFAIAPPASAVPAPAGLASSAFQPDVRGVYAIERWLRYGVGEDLTHRFVVEVSGAAPIAAARATAAAGPGNPVMLDASESKSPERRTLTFTWRLTTRPRDSSAILAAADATTASLVPDVVGDYGIELAVFDGELWSDPHASLTVRVAAP